MKGKEEAPMHTSNTTQGKELYKDTIVNTEEKQVQSDEEQKD